MPSSLSCTGFSPSLIGLPSAVPLDCKVTSAVLTPACTHTGLGSSHFARRYFENRFFFLFLSLLRCFSSGGSPPYTMYSCMDTRSFSVWVSPFRYPRINRYLLLPVAFRSLSRLSSAQGAKASALRSFLLNLFFLVLFFNFGYLLHPFSLDGFLSGNTRN